MPDLKFKDGQIEFEKRVLELGLSYGVNHNDIYEISSPKVYGNHIKVQLISSLPIIRQVLDSRNGNDVQAIGLFKFKFPSSGLEPDILAFTFQNPVKNQIEFLIIPTQKFIRRYSKVNPVSVHPKSVEMVLWLLEDGFIYDTTNISPEGEWYFLSKGVNGRMADGTELDYSEYLNSWRRLIVQ